MKRIALHKTSARSLLQSLLWLLLLSALIAPKVSVAIVAVSGAHTTSVVFCTGAGLARVTVTPDGQIVPSDETRLPGSPCLLPDHRCEQLALQWHDLAHPHYGQSVLALRRYDEGLSDDHRALSGHSSRGPPTIT